MTEPLDPLESELAALQPLQPSAELQDRIEEKLKVRANSRRQQLLIGVLALTGCLAATAAAVVFRVYLPPGGPHPFENKHSEEATDFSLAAALDPAQPSLWSFHRALAGPERDLDALLDKQAGLSARSDSQPTPFRVLRSSDAEINHLLGEL